MPIDPTIALGVKQYTRESPLNLLGQVLQVQGLQRQNQLGELDMREREAAATERNALRDFLTKNQNLDAPETQAKLYGVAPTQAGGIIKSRLEVLKAQGDIGKTAAETEKARVETEKARLAMQHDKVTRNLQTLARVNTPDAAKQWISNGLKAGLLTMEQASQELAGIPSDPQGFARWKDEQSNAGLSLAQQVEQKWKAQEFGLKANNELMMPDGKGGYIVNQPLLGAKQSVAKSGASSVSINTGQKGYENESKLRNDFKSEPIYKDYQDMSSAYKQIKAGLAQGTPIADVAAATKIMKLLDPGSVVRESELGIAMAAAGKLDRLQNIVQMWAKGEKLTPTQRKDFGALADELMAAAGQAYNKKRGEYAGFGQRYGLDENVLGDPFQSSRPAAPGGGMPDASAIDAEIKAREARRKGK